MKNYLNKQVINTNELFDKHGMSVRALYFYLFNRIPSNHYLGDLKGGKPYEIFKEHFGHLIENEYQYRWYDQRKGKYQYGETYFVLKNRCVVEIKNYCDIFHDGTQQAFIDECTELLRAYRERYCRPPLEVNLIVSGGRGVELKSMEVKRTNLDLGLYYEDDFKEIDEMIRKRLNQKNDRGIVLLHGLPGTGKTTYLRYLVGKIKKRVLFLSPNMADNLTDPGFIELLIENPNSVVIIEDAENILLDRKVNGRSGVANLLNISDGLLADFLNVQLICTFNSPLTMVDTALTRKGRLIARYQFDKLSIPKAKALSAHLNLNREITRPMTVAEICNPEKTQIQEEKIEVIGFKTTPVNN